MLICLLKMRLEANFCTKTSIILFLICGVVFLLMLLLSVVTKNGSKTAISFHDDRSRATQHFDFELRKDVVELNANLKELNDVKAAIINDLQALGKKYFSAREDIQKLSAIRQRLLSDVQKSKTHFDKLKKELNILQTAVGAKRMQVDVPIAFPKPLVNVANLNVIGSKCKNSSRLPCTLSTCFDYSSCPLLSKLSVFVYKPKNEKEIQLDLDNSMIIYKKLMKMTQIEEKPQNACLYIVPLVLDLHRGYASQQMKILKYLKSLEFWRNNGQNHLVLLVSKGSTQNTGCKMVEELTRTKAIVASSFFCHTSHRDNFDILLFPTSSMSVEKQSWEYFSSLVPIERKYLFTILYLPHKEHNIQHEDILALKGNATDIHIEYQCVGKDNKNILSSKNCQSSSDVEKALSESVFTIFFVFELEQHYTSLLEFLIISFKNGVVPVFIGEHFPLPFGNLIDFKKAVLHIPSARITEVYFILRTIKKSDIFSLKKTGRFIFETYFSSLPVQMQTILSAMQNYIKLPPNPLSEYQAKLLIEKLSNNKIKKTALKTPSFSQNWTLSNVDWFNLWNTYPGGHFLLPYLPRSNNLPTSVQFSEDMGEYMPIGNGRGGDGMAFGNSIGGDEKIEHFTIVILTYDRELILTESLQRLAGLKYLNRIIVIWNNPITPSHELDWPDVGVPLHIVKGEKNSLNNRFLPYDLIDTEAVLSMDDDIYLRYDEIELAFRVWRENRDRIVGFPGRYHAWNSDGASWSYNANYSCELSMVLTGGAFFHKYYTYLYTYMMPNAIRDMVDEYMNCEDIAMNFLVAHVTGKPPIKVTSRWTFRCPGCPTSLSYDDTHYVERDICLSFFQRVYGYMPLRKTQFRADSILFKTRLPPGKRKCYTFV